MIGPLIWRGHFFQSSSHLLKCGPRGWRTKVHTGLRQEESAQWNLRIS